MADADDNIPTLTDIAHPGDTEMLNHFDAHQFDIDTGDDDEADIEFDVALNDDANISNVNITDEILTGEPFESENLTGAGISNGNVTDNINSSPELEQLLKEIPSIQIKGDTHIELDNNDFSAAMQTVTVATQTSENANKNDNPETHDKELKEKIDQAIKEALPGIEAQLKGKLYSKFGV